MDILRQFTGKEMHQNNLKLLVNNIIEGTTVNGPGFRFGIWMQGCNRNCPGCFNKEACTPDGGYFISVDEIINKFSRQKYDGISVSGGEPFYQEEGLTVLLQQIKEAGADTLVFTGFTYDELVRKNCKSLLYCDYLIDGPYIKDCPSHCKYTGSGNQRFLKLNEGIIQEDLTDKTEDITESEFIINQDGSITTTGFLNI